MVEVCQYKLPYRVFPIPSLLDVYGANNEDFDVYKGEIDNDTTPQVDGGSCVMNSTCTLDETVSGSDGTQYLSIWIDTDAVGDHIYGGKITIIRTI